MIPPKYNFYIGTVRYISLNYGRIDLDGNFISDEYFRSSNLLEIPKSRKVYFMNSPLYGSTARISYYDSTRKYKGYNIISKGINTIGDVYSYYAISFQANDTAFSNNNFLAELITVNPHYKELNKKYAKESGQEFFRISLDGRINLFGQDYELVANSSLEDRLIFIIEKYNNTSKKWIEYYEGEFNKTDCKLDRDKKKCELKTTALDYYSNIMNKCENTYDLIKLAPAITHINLYKRPLMQVYIRGANSITNFFGGIYWEDDVNEAIDNYNDLINKYYFSYVASGNEFYVTGSRISGVNGVYAGIDGSWNNWNGYTCYADNIVKTGLNDSIISFDIKIKRNSDDVVLYEGHQLTIENRGEYDISIVDTAELTNPNDDSDKCNISTVFVYDIFQRLLCDVDSVEDSEGTKNMYDLPSDDFVTDNRNYKKCIGLQGGLFFCTSRTVDTPTKYGINDYNEYFTNRFIAPSTGINRVLPLSRNSWANASLWYAYDLFYEQFEEKLRKRYTLKDSYSIAAVIKVLLNEIDPALRHEATAEYSRFLYDRTVPISMSRFYVYITQKTNILKGEYDQPAQKAEISFENLMGMLRDCFRCYWYIEDGKFKIEHIYFFMNGGSYSNNSNIQLDFTKLTDRFNKKQLSYFQTEVEYDKSDLNQRYEFGWMDDVTDLFGGVTIDVKSNYIQKDKNEEINISQFSSDVDYMLFNPSNFSEDGFALLCPILSGSSYELPIIETQLVDENGDTYDAVIQNFYAAWAYLVRFYMYDMPANNIECNVLNNLYTRAIKMCMKHTIEFPTGEDLNELELIKTSIGDGKIDEISIDIDTRHAKVRLLYRPQ
jgi:hypothetical protein